MDGVVFYTLESGDVPFLTWVRKLDDKVRAVVQVYVQRVARGGSRKNVRYLDDCVWEIKIPYRHGAMRVYFGKINGVMVLLGGSKTSQNADIKRAKKYWRSYAETHPNL